VNVDSGTSQDSSASSALPERPGVGVFATTHWSVVLSALDKESRISADALEQLCRVYWYPLYAYARRVTSNPTDAEDLTQGFFAKLLQKDYLRSVARDKGRFRTFLLTVLKRFMANEWDRQHAQKRGAFTPAISIDSQTAEERFASETAHTLPPDRLFDRHWALALLEQTMAQLRDEYVASGRAALFEHLQKCLTQDEGSLPYTAIASRLNSTEAAVKMAMSRLRARYREVLRAQIAQTVTSETEVEDEVRHLFSAFG
jgi:RNA polymerase sigma factor (sigma-70 family)